MCPTQWEQHIEEAREQKDWFFAGHPQSPLPAARRSAFRGLAYYPIDPAYRFELGLHKHEGKEIIETGDTAGQMRTLWRWGEFRFPLGGQDCTLKAYKSDPDEERLFVPFRDATSGTETYSAGRYLDLEPARHLTSEGKWVVDFNEAYNPWCAYSEDYACPFVPPENWLQVPVRAGERSYEHG
ncbi:MAG: hypothetical protein AMK73_00060 [Planctomycetes bacterium SM23_32]|nr:MAG: hypothetical protein AMK73_00060 [Planctomycetes bacterium SM23_32]